MAGKHGETGNKNAKKKSKLGISTKVIFIIAIAIAIIAGIYCKNNIWSNNKKQVRETINITLSSLKNLDKEKAKEYINYNTLVSSIDPMIIQGENATDLEEELFKNISWKIKSINIEENEAKVMLQINNKNYKNIFTNWMKDIVKEKKNGTLISEDFALRILKEKIEEEKEMINAEKEITLKQENDKWIFFVDENLRNAIFPGIDVVSTVLNK